MAAPTRMPQTREALAAALGGGAWEYARDFRTTSSNWNRGFGAPNMSGSASVTGVAGPLDDAFGARFNGFGQRAYADNIAGIAPRCFFLFFKYVPAAAPGNAVTISTFRDISTNELIYHAWIAGDAGNELKVAFNADTATPATVITIPADFSGNVWHKVLITLDGTNAHVYTDLGSDSIAYTTLPGAVNLFTVGHAYGDIINQIGWDITHVYAAAGSNASGLDASSIDNFEAWMLDAPATPSAKYPRNIVELTTAMDGGGWNWANDMSGGDPTNIAPLFGSTQITTFGAPGSDSNYAGDLVDDLALVPGIGVEHYALIFVPGTQAFALSFKLVAALGANPVNLASGNVGQPNGFMTIVQPDGTMSFVMGSGFNIDGTPIDGTNAINLSGNYADGEWHHLLIKFDVGTGCEVFTDLDSGTTGWPAGQDFNSYYAYFGKVSSFAGHHFALTYACRADVSTGLGANSIPNFMAWLGEGGGEPPAEPTIYTDAEGDVGGLTGGGSIDQFTLYQSNQFARVDHVAVAMSRVVWQLREDYDPHMAEFAGVVSIGGLEGEGSYG